MRKLQSHCFADEFGITHAALFRGTDKKHDYSHKEIAEQCRLCCSTLLFVKSQTHNKFSIITKISYGILNIQHLCDLLLFPSH